MNDLNDNFKNRLVKVKPAFSSTVATATASTPSISSALASTPSISSTLATKPSVLTKSGIKYIKKPPTASRQTSSDSILLPETKEDNISNYYEPLADNEEENPMHESAKAVYTENIIEEINKILNNVTGNFITSKMLFEINTKLINASYKPLDKRVKKKSTVITKLSNK